jgi:integrase/recombinase XerC
MNIICTKKDPFQCLNSYPSIYKVCLSIETYLQTDLRVVCLYARLVTEQILKEVANRSNIFLQMDIIGEIIKLGEIKKAIPPTIIDKIKNIARVGNSAVHNVREPNTLGTLNSLRDLVDVVYWFVSKLDRSKVERTPASQVFAIDSKVKLCSNKVSKVIDEFVNLRTKKNTRNIYQNAIDNFAAVVYPHKSTTTAIKLLLKVPGSVAIENLATYRQELIENTNLSDSSINQRLSVMNSFIHHCFVRGYCQYSVRVAVISIKTPASRIDPECWMLAIDTLDRSTVKGCRDYAILQLMVKEKIFRQDIARIKLEHLQGQKLSIELEDSIRPKEVTLSVDTMVAIRSWLKLRPKLDNEYLFVPLCHSLKYAQKNLSERGIYNLIKNIGESANLDFTLNARSIFKSLG